MSDASPNQDAHLDAGRSELDAGPQYDARVIAPPSTVEVVPTFQSIGLYWTPLDVDGTDSAEVRFRVAGASDWREGLMLWYDRRDSQYRGSLVELIPNTLYEIELSLVGGEIREHFTVRTWSENYPIARTVTVPTTLDEPLIVDESGTADGYVLYAPAPGEAATIDVGERGEAAVEIRGVHHVIIRGLTITSAERFGFLFTEASHDVVIQGNDVSGWGINVSGGIRGKAEHAAVSNMAHSSRLVREIERIVVERNRFHHPNSTSNSWLDPMFDGEREHPGGPNAVFFQDSLGNHVIRYNEVYSDADHYLQDGFGAGANRSREGFPGRDSDVYGNYVANVWDDAIEAEGGGMNVRIWGNYIDHTYTRIALASVTRGPLYAWRNIGAASRYSAMTDNSDEYGRGNFFKLGNADADEGGRTYIFHNTDLNPPPSAGRSRRLGAAGMIAAGGNTFEVIARNNVMTNYNGGGYFSNQTGSCTNDVDFNLFYGVIGDRHQCAERAHDRNGIELIGDMWWDYLDPSGVALVFGPRGRVDRGVGSFPLRAESSGVDAAERIANFNDAFAGAGPDIGAFERGGPMMEFGVDAYR